MNSRAHPKCSVSGCGCASADPAEKDAPRGLGRREFLRFLGAGATAAMAFHPWQYAMAGPFTRADFEKLVPADKKLTPEWVKSLTARGERTVYRGPALANIGMPIGGICAGQLYLGGDGTLWHWDIFNSKIGTGAEHFANPMKASSPVDHGFALKVEAGGKTQERRMAAGQWRDITFTGEYPVGYVSYADPDCPVAVQLEAFSPFSPLNVADSSLPATISEFTIKNTGNSRVCGEFGGWLENAVCLFSAPRRGGTRTNRSVREPQITVLECSAEDLPAPSSDPRPDIAFESFEKETYDQWTVAGTAFGTGPAETGGMPAYQGEVGARGKRLANSHASAPGGSVEEKDNAKGRLTSRPFAIERNYITFLIGGGNHKARTCMNLVIDGQVVLSATGAADNRLQPMSWDVRAWQGQTGQLVIVDDQAGPWGNVGIDEIVFSDRPLAPLGPLAQEEDFGTMALTLLGSNIGDRRNPDVGKAGIPAGIFSSTGSAERATKPFGEKLVGSLARKFELAPGESVKLTFVLTWFLPNLRMNRLAPGRHYGTRFNSAHAVAVHVAKNYQQLSSQTRLWHDTWYDSSLPYWFLDRTFLNISILATSTCYRFVDGRFYSWEGVGCCEGTCGHVWQYAHAVARLFPQLERSVREKVDFGLGLQRDGAIHFRGEFNNIPAIDAQAGTILRALREHQMSADDSFLRKTWPGIKKATEWLMAKDANGDGLIESNQHNTLDTDWFGPVAWLSGLYLAALLGAEAMAIEAGDREFAGKCRQIFDGGRNNLVSQLFNGEYFINKVDPRHLDAINSGTGCEIDQVMGQSWAFQVGLSRVLPEKETLSALRSLWRYNFTPDVGPYRTVYKPGRWYAMPGEAGLLMCTFPRSDWDYAQAKGKGPDWAAGYFNECMNGFEYQAAAHMIWEGLITEGLAVTRAVHDRYHASRRNPFNEIECGDHYVRSMASYGVYIAACGYEYHGPQGRLAFAPRITPENFKGAFTVAEGWGSYRQRREAGTQTHEIQLKSGKLQLKTLAVEVAPGATLVNATANLEGKNIPVKSVQNGRRVELEFTPAITVQASMPLQVALKV